MSSKPVLCRPTSSVLLSGTVCVIHLSRRAGGSVFPRQRAVHSVLFKMAATQAGAPQPQGQPVDVDPISKFKMLVPRLKESLAVSLQSYDFSQLKNE